MLPQFHPPDVGLGAPFWDGVARGELVLPRCTMCGRWQWYPETSGTDCTGGELDWVSVATTGTLYSHTSVHRSFLPGGRDLVPYAVGMVDLDRVEGPRLVVSLDDRHEYAVGDRVRATFVDLHGRTHPVFVPEERP